MDCYRDMADVEQTFVEFMDRVPFYGMVVACNDDAALRAILPRVRRRIVTYGTAEGSDFLIRCSPCDAEQLALGFLNNFAVEYRGKSLGDFLLRVPGMHNVRNATAAIAIGVGLDIPPDKIRVALTEFRGVDRRFQLKGQANGVSVIDDYGHHPTEIRATLAAAKECGFGDVHVIFQPHRYTRTRDLMEEFATAFEDADSLYLLDIYPASEQPIEGVTTEALARRITEQSGKPTYYVKSFQVAAIMASTAAKPGDMILTLGAGNVSQLGPQILDRLNTRSATPSI
jgi:UDP-N-acetylmuramate--alanine ligase